MNSQFNHLKIHSEYSICDSLLRIDELVAQAKAFGMSAIALTDLNNLFALVKFYRQALAAGIKPVIGAELTIVEGNNIHRATFLCQNQQGYLNLIQLISLAYLQGQQQFNQPAISWEMLTQHAEGLIALSGGLDGDVGKTIITEKKTQAEKLICRWRELFPNRFYLEIQRIGREYEEDYIQLVLLLAEKTQIPVVATNDVRFLTVDDFEAHEARVCIQTGEVLTNDHRKRYYTEQQYFRSSEEMHILFADVPTAIENTAFITQRCNLTIELGKPYLPNFPTPKHESLESYIRSQAEQGLVQRLQQQFSDSVSTEQHRMYQKRLDTELDVINCMGFPGYFLIVADFVNWAKQHDIPVAPGRGSGVGSLVAYALGITALDPIEHELLFERFLNPERVSMPDFDIDFCMEQRDRVIEYVTERYGRDAVSQIITFGTMAAKAVVRDVGRVLSLPYGFVDKVAKLIPFELGMTLTKALEQEPQLKERYDNEEEVTTLIDLALKLEGLARNAGKHAAGVVIASTKVTDFAPLYCEANGEHPVTQFDKDDAEAVGLVKFDFLGLRTLTIIDWAVHTINAKRQQQGEQPLDISQLPLDDQKTYQLLQNCQTTAVFQLESRGMKDLIRRLKPDVFEEIMALVALFRPGPLQSGMVDDFIARKHGRAPVEHLHPDIKFILKPTYGVILYQEQVMQIAQVLAGYTLGGADLLRRAMGKKKPEEMAKQREVFVSGAIDRGIQAKIAEHIFDLMEKFAGYGFNKSHSAAYALIAYQTAWLKAHYPAEFMAAVLSSDMDNTDKVVGFLEECKQLALTVASPDINLSHYKFTVGNDGSIQYGLGAIKGVGEAAIEQIINERETQGEFTSLFNFCERLDSQKVGRRTLEPLIRSGAFDRWQQNRAVLLASVGRALHVAEQVKRNREMGQVDLFGELRTQSRADEEYVSVPSMSEREKLEGEKECLGFYLSGHPLAMYEKELKQFSVLPINELISQCGNSALLAGMLLSTRKLMTRNGRHMAILSIEDLTGRTDVAVLGSLYDEVVHTLEKGMIYVLRGKIDHDDYTGGVRVAAESIKLLAAVRAEMAKRVVVRVNSKSQVENLLQKMPNLIKPFIGGHCPVVIAYQSEQASAELLLGKQYWIKPYDELLESLCSLCEETQVLIEY